MKNIKMSLKKIKITSLGLGVLFLASCLKDDKAPEDYSQTPALVSFQFKGVSQVPLTASLLPGTDVIFPLEVTLSVPSITSGSTVTATATLDQQSLDDYNTANGTTYQMLPSDQYTVDNGGVVTIKPGQQIVALNIHVNVDAIDFSTDPALAFKLTAATGAMIATNLNVAIIPVKLRNQFEGTYDVTGYFVHPTGPRPIGQAKKLATISPIRSEAPLGDLAGYFFDFDVDGSNNLINWAPIGSTPAVSGFINGVDNTAGNSTYPGPPFVHTTYNNTYDPANTTFWMHYGYNPNNTREIYEKWVLQ